MPDTIKLNDLLKAAPAASSLETSDRLLAVDSAGGLKRISKQGFGILEFTSEAGKWYKIATTTSGLASCGRLYVVSAPGQQESLIIDFAFGQSASSSKDMFKITNPSLGANVLKQAAVGKPNTSARNINFYIYTAESRVITVASEGINVSPVKAIVEDPSVNYFTFTYDLTQSGG